MPALMAVVWALRSAFGTDLLPSDRYVGRRPLAHETHGNANDGIPGWDLVGVFVVGRRHITRERSYWWRVRHPHHREMKEERRRVWADYGNRTLRMLSWFAGGALVVSVAQLIQWIRDRP
jgi:hypothetical protein